MPEVLLHLCLVLMYNKNIWPSLKHIYKEPQTTGARSEAAGGQTAFPLESENWAASKGVYPRYIRNPTAHMNGFGSEAMGYGSEICVLFRYLCR